MSKMKLTIDTTDIETMYLGSTDVHWRIITARETGEATSVCVQDFDYYGYGDRFITEVCFANERDANKAAKLINKVGVKHFA